jgi:hypothetical protein
VEREAAGTHARDFVERSFKFGMATGEDLEPDNLHCQKKRASPSFAIS